MQKSTAMMALAQVAMGVGSGLSKQAFPQTANDVLLPLPPMGFNNWARFLTNINESIFVDVAQAMVRTGLLKAGFNRINLDDAWSLKQRASNGSLEWDGRKFPHGLPWLTAFLISKGFIPGIYSDAGTLSCGQYPGSLGHEDVDLKDFSSWGFEYLKLDGCYVPGPRPDEGNADEASYRRLYEHWHELLSHSEKPLIFSISAPAYFSEQKNLTDWYTVMGWSQTFGQLARHSSDIQTYPGGDSWKSMLANYNQEVRLARYQKPGFFNDPDFLNVDHPSYTLDEKRSHFTLWCSFSAPLIISADIGALKRDETSYLTNKDLIAVNQDRLVQQATLVSRNDSWDVLTKSLENGDRLLTVLNKGNQSAYFAVPWARLGFPSSSLKVQQKISVKDLWSAELHDIPSESPGITLRNVPRHGTVVLRITTSTGSVIPTSLIFNTFSMKCLTDSPNGTVTFGICDGSGGQTWQVNTQGRINSLLRPRARLTNIQGTVRSENLLCSRDHWRCEKSGNIINIQSELCLTQRPDGVATATSCGYETNEKVFALPVGVPVVEQLSRNLRRELLRRKTMATSAC